MTLRSVWNEANRGRKAVNNDLSFKPEICTPNVWIDKEEGCSDRCVGKTYKGKVYSYVISPFEYVARFLKNLESLPVLGIGGNKDQQ